jgi:hypothetical protein
MTIINLGDASITTAISALVITSGVSGGVTVPYIDGLDDMSELSMEFYFGYGSGGATLTAWLQSSVSQGARWHDIASFSATTETMDRMLSLKRTSDTNLWTPINGALAANTVASSIVLGDRLRVLLTTTGTYGGSSLLSCRASVR